MEKKRKKKVILGEWKKWEKQLRRNVRLLRFVVIFFVVVVVLCCGGGGKIMRRKRERCSWGKAITKFCELFICLLIFYGMLFYFYLKIGKEI